MSDADLQKALAFGFALFIDTTDTPAMVVAWYASHLGGYAQHSESAGTQFQGADGVVNVVVYQGKTRIALIPK